MKKLLGLIAAMPIALAACGNVDEIETIDAANMEELQEKMDNALLRVTDGLKDTKTTLEIDNKEDKVESCTATVVQGESKYSVKQKSNLIGIDAGEAKIIIDFSKADAVVYMELEGAWIDATAQDDEGTMVAMRDTVGCDTFMKDINDSFAAIAKIGAIDVAKEETEGKVTYTYEVEQGKAKFVFDTKTDLPISLETTSEEVTSSISFSDLGSTVIEVPTVTPTP